ncbi:sulfite exporter TauE/SafE family protein [Hydromonas duriensis]|uniref:Probable membrane transporter protein n=1 Tax=Hydromonas duriensis TaxID=1527608 RepID=A0A4R6Y8U9_9BURK|nr:sulfite exporter TauE/SafE family protein [Hydromonas duriensis]TDR31843.1 putative membrane protein YfcA [Hydromonas duriensis]
MDLIWLAYPILGCFVGFLAGLLGVGGGLVTVPLLTLILQAQGIHHPDLHKIALASSTTTIAFTAFSSMRSHAAHQNVRWDIVKHILPGIILGTFIGAYLVHILPVSPLRAVFAMFAFYTAYNMLSSRLPKPSRTLPRSPALFGVGNAVGILSTLISAGGGFISVPFMIWCNVPTRLAIGTSAALGFPIALFAVVGYLLTADSAVSLPPHTFAYIYFPAVLGIAMTSMLVAPIGAKIAQRWDVAVLKKIFACLLIVLGIQMVYKMGTGT